MDDATTSPPHIIYEADLIALYARYGVGDMVGVEGAEDRVIELPEGATLGCPMHLKRLVPDACRSCRLLSGEVPAPLG